jgi:hypothetical protein
VLEVVRRASSSIKAPIVMFTYYNPIMARGLDKFCKQAKEAGASGANWAGLGWAGLVLSTPIQGLGTACRYSLRLYCSAVVPLFGPLLGKGKSK